MLVQTQAELEKERKILSDFDKKIAMFEAAVKTKSAQVAEIQLEMSKTKHEIEKFQRDKEEAQQAILQMESNYDWILYQKQ